MKKPIIFVFTVVLAVVALAKVGAKSNIYRANSIKPNVSANSSNLVKVSSSYLSSSSQTTLTQSSSAQPLTLRDFYKDTLVSVSFKKTNLNDVIRSLNASYGINVLVQQGIEAIVDLHLEKVPIVEALEGLCRAQNLELSDDGKVFMIQKPTIKTFQVIAGSQQKIDLDVQNQEAKAFIKDFAAKTGLKILASPDLKGTVTGSWKNQPAMDGFRALMDAHGYNMRYKSDFLIVEPGDGAPGFQQNVQSGNYRPPGSTGRGLQVDYHQGKLSLNLDNADLGDVLKSIAKETRLNIILYGDVREAVTAKLDKVTLEEALSAIMKGSRFTYTRTTDSTLIVGSKDPKTESGKILTTYEIYKLKHIKAEDVTKLLPGSISPSALTVHKEQNAIIITGTDVEIGGIKKYLDLLDQPIPQVLLECIIVEFSRGNNDEFGMRTGGSAKKTGDLDKGPGITLLVGHQGEAVVWDRTINDVYSSIGMLPLNFMTNITALESRNKAKVLAMPRVTTLNGNKSSIQVTNTSYYPVNTISKDGFPVTDFKPINDGISLDITPFITSGGEITIDIKPEIKTSKVSSATDRPSDISSRNLQTTIKLRDGETALLGGLIQNNMSKVREGIPILGSIPILGYLFSYYKNLEQTTELMVFVTPRVLRDSTSGIDVSSQIKKMEDRDDFGNYGKDIKKVRE